MEGKQRYTLPTPTPTADGERGHRRVDALAREELAGRVEDPLALGRGVERRPADVRNGHSGILPGMAIPASGSERRSSPTVTLVVLGLAGFIYAAIQSAVLPALPNFQRSLHTSVDGAGWILITYLLSASVATPIIGRLGDMHGKHRLLVATLAGLCAGTLLAALSHSIALLYVARVIQGVSGGIVPLSFGIVRDEIPRARVATSIGIVSSMLGVGGGAGIVLGALVLEHASWQWLFWAALLPSVLVAVLALARDPALAGADARPGQLDRGGADERRHVGRADRRQRSRELGMGLAEDARPPRSSASPGARPGSAGRSARASRSSTCG